ncbi:enoyl-CoA hydratase/isomerase family protein [Nocardioides sp. zg-536]|uniref:Enoyl-CoA hydratase/isomerase family protein n=1 Tax=Nocardioides faecalis TaxID=2803858 RepID=A0A939BX21_9ACTN|nr:enoyl-CoA hydratase-related protein [Nocardioides faecalis]MBM9458350.1 enoyl-CoA hydratase/isomerase family protein [Nocardioides faecalis]MBS4753349.1 enoyl-CoA hydratase/isomerase family protein [Nocardioides faecalis]QVI58375.1 enoyl-CoA hydratase/isomerase family protein [Nocardioides faecalis]
MGVLEVTRSGGVLLLRLNRPAQRNALDRALTDALSAAFDELDDDPSLHVGILAANGPVFCAGTDLHEPASPATDRGGEYGLVRRRRTTPLIAAVEGAALGGGLEVVLSCDLVVAGAEARFGLPEVARGLVATCGGLFRTPDRVPPVIAAELVLTGDPIAAHRAYEVGMINRLVPAGQALDAARGLAERITRNSPDAVSASLGALADARGPAEAVGWTATDKAIATVVRSPDPLEGVAAFFEKRPPRWAR